MSRIKLLSREDMSPEQLEIYKSIESGPRGVVVGPLRAAIHSPELARRWSKFGEFIRYQTSVPLRSKELAIIVTGRRWSSDVEWWVHASAALDAGVDKEIVAAVKDGARPVFESVLDRAVYDYARETLELGKPGQNAYSAVLEEWGEAGVVELTAIIGYYTMVAMTLNAHEVPLPDGVDEELTAPSDGLFSLAPSAVAADVT